MNYCFVMCPQSAQLLTTAVCAHQQCALHSPRLKHLNSMTYCCVQLHTHFSNMTYCLATPQQYDLLLNTTTYPFQQYDPLLDHASTV